MVNVNVIDLMSGYHRVLQYVLGSFSVYSVSDAHCCCGLYAN